MIVNYSDQDVIKGGKSIFLAGPTPRNERGYQWRNDAIKILEKLKFDGIVYIPEFSNMQLREDYVEQVYWEREALTEATVITFWVPRELPEMPGFTTNVEFGYWLHTGKVIYGRPDTAVKIKYLDWLYELDYGKKPINQLEELLRESIKMCEERYKK
jgi:hypothetical protein